MGQKINTIAVALLPFMVAAVVLANQPSDMPHLAGRLFHLVSIAGAVGMLIYATGRNAAPYVAIIGALFLIGYVTKERQPYEIFLNVLFFAAGMIAASTARVDLTKAMLGMTLVSGSIMLLQVIGAGEWTQMLTTHGILACGGKLAVPMEPTLFVPAAEFQGSYLQGRPSGLFHSNQFASLVVLVTFALTLAMSARVHIAVGFALCVVATLLLSKVVFLGIALMLVTAFLMGLRRVSLMYAGMMGISIFGYATLFPGLFQLFFINPHVLIVSVVVRVLDMATAMGFDAGDAMASLRRIGAIDAGQMNEALVSRIVADNAVAGRSTAFATLSQYSPIFVSAFSAWLLAWLAVPSFRRWIGVIRASIEPLNVLVFIALLSFCLAADFLAAGIFWAFAGMAAPQSQRETDFRSTATATIPHATT